MSDQTAVSALKPAFRFPFETREATNRFLAGSGLLLLGMFIPILPTLFVFGYCAQVLRRTARREAPAMHAWDDWGAMLKDGFRSWAIAFLFFLPSMAVFFLGFAAYFASFIPLLGADPGRGEEALGLMFLVGMGTLFLSFSVGSLLLVLASIPLPVALAHFAVEDRFAAAFHFRAWWPILRRNLLGILIAWVVVFGLLGVLWFATLVAYYTFVLICLLFFLVLPAYFYILLVGAAVYGDVYAEGRALAVGA